METSPRTEEAVAAWNATAHEADAQIRAKYPGVQLPPTVTHFMHDADIRVRDEALHSAQLSEIRHVISCLERGEVPEVRSTTIPVTLRGGIIAAGVLIIAIVLGVKSCA